MIQAIRGTYDVLPDRVGVWHALEARLRETFHRYGFGESADKLGARFVIIIGEEELKSGKLLLRDMATKEPKNVTEGELL